MRLRRILIFAALLLAVAVAGCKSTRLRVLDDHMIQVGQAGMHKGIDVLALVRIDSGGTLVSADFIGQRCD